MRPKTDNKLVVKLHFPYLHLLFIALFHLQGNPSGSISGRSRNVLTKKVIELPSMQQQPDVRNIFNSVLVYSPAQSTYSSSHKLTCIHPNDSNKLIFWLSFAKLVTGYFFECCAKNSNKNGPGNLKLCCVLLSIYNHIAMYISYCVWNLVLECCVSTAEESWQQMGETKWRHQRWDWGGSKDASMLSTLVLSF